MVRDLVWVLRQASFRQLQRYLSLQVDIFTPPGHARLPFIKCPIRHPGTTALDTLSADWNRWSTIYLSPPPPPYVCLCLRNLRAWTLWSLRDFPFWPSNAWWPQLPTICSAVETSLVVERLVRRVRVYAPKKDDVLALPHLFSNQTFEVGFLNAAA